MDMEMEMFEDTVFGYGGDNHDADDLGIERCGICMDVVIDRGVLDCCEHWYCFACIDNWASITNLCPLCQIEFQMITCVPVYDTIGGGKVEDDSLSRDEDWCVQGTNNALSFPSYYIDENAVICLDGNGCKIRNGVETCLDDSALETSIACDSCDLWYHAYCVDFDTESTSENSWLCPRCVDEVPHKSEGAALRVAYNQHGPEETGRGHSTEDAQSGRVSVSVADAGETAVVVSMIEGKHWAKESSDNCPSLQDNDKNNQTLDKESNPQLCVDGRGDSLALSLSKDAHLTVEFLHINELETNFADKAVPEPIVSDTCQILPGLLSGKLSVEGEPSQIGNKVDLHLGLCVGSSLPAEQIDSDATERDKSEVSQPQNLLNEFSASVKESDPDANQDTAGSSCVKRKSMSSSVPVLLTEYNEVDKIGSCHGMVSDPPAKKTKGDDKYEQIRSRDGSSKIISENSKDCPHLPADYEEKADNMDTKDKIVAEDDDRSEQICGRDGSCKIVSGSGKDSSNLLADYEHEANNMDTTNEMVAKIPTRKVKVGEKSQWTHGKTEHKKSVEGVPQKCVLPPTGSKDDKLRKVPGQQDCIPDIMSIVRGSNRKASSVVSHLNHAKSSLKEKSTGAGVRVKKIMRTASKDESSKLVENLRKEIREAVRSKASKDHGKSNPLDPKLLLAFRNALAGSKSEEEPVRKLDPSIVRAKRSMLQKGKTRESLTKKIYGNSNGRRKRAWDRDWEVEFWKHRCKRASKTEKLDTLQSVLELLTGGSESSKIEPEPVKEVANPILSRLYLADASVFPRKDDIKPLSALTGVGNDILNKEDSAKEKVLKPVSIYQTLVQSRNNLPQCSTDEAAYGKVSSNVSIDKRNCKSMESAPKVNDHSLKESLVKSDGKIDKRKWALEVLARKSSTVQNTASQVKEDDNTMLKGNFPLLKQLPPDMRPVLATSRHNKVPTSVRQAQLYRLTEHFLRKADVPIFRRTADTELAVADAVNTEQEVVNRSSSKLVYLNLCSQVISQQLKNKRPDKVVESAPSEPVVHSEVSDPAPKLSSDMSDEAALRLAGLLSDSPPNSPCQQDDIDNNPPVSEDREPDNVFDIETQELDIYGDFEYDLDNEDYIGVVPKVHQPQMDEGDSKLKVVFSTLSTHRTDVVETTDKESLGITSKPNDAPCQELHEDVVSLDVRTESACPPPESLQEEAGEELSLAECEELYGPDKEPFVYRFPEETLMGSDSSTGKGILVESKSPSENADCIPSKAASDLNTESHPQRKKEKDPDRTKHSDIYRSITKKVEAYIKEHIRPLCKSGVITVDQYRWAVERTRTKIMKYHSKDTNANFLIKEGEKVKKLAEQYVEAAQKNAS